MANSKLSDELVETIIRGDCVPFLGAGFSIQAGMPSTKQLLEDLAKRMNYKLSDSDSFEKVTEIYANYKGDVELRKIFLKYLDSSNINLSKGYIIFGELIRRGYFKTVITTNYDKVIEKCIKHSKGSMPKLRPISTPSPIPFIENDDVQIIKYHGSMERESTMVITESDYFCALDKRAELYQYLRSIFQTKNLLIIGFSMQDIDFRLLFNQLRYDSNKFSRRGYLICRPNSNHNWELQKHYYWANKNVDTIEMEIEDFFIKLIQRIQASA